jgi:asparagine synthase (glutamine-hydrolysing)
VCGIVAAFSAAGGIVERDVAAGLAAQRHRGPDGAASWVSPCGRIALGHNRLAIIDPATSAQPMRTEDGGLCLVTNGEFYDYPQIQAELLRTGARLLTRSDTEILLHLYALDGPGALRRLRGEFAFVLWDAQRGMVFAARDRFGCKPLYYAWHEGRLYLASEVKALLAMGVPARWDTESLADHLLVGCLSDRTLFAGVRQVPPGCYLLANPNGMRLHRYWDLDYPPAATIGSAGGDRHAATIGSLIRDAVRTRMRADVPVAYHLSGGLDSAAVVCLAAQWVTPPTFTVRFDDPGLDEGAQARATAAYAGAAHTEIFFDWTKHATRIEQTIGSGEMIQENCHGTARLVQAEAIRAHGFKVALAGEGGDELFAGYPQTRRDLAFTLSPLVRRHAEQRYAKLLASECSAHLRSLLRSLGFVPAWMLDRYMTVTQPLMAVLREDFAETVSIRQPCASLLNGPEATDQLVGRTPYHQSMYLFCKIRLCNYILAAERLDMAYGLEVRLPLLDHQLADAVKWTLPADHLTGATPKPVLRDAMRAHLPDAVYRGGKRGFFAPPAVTDERVLGRLRAIVERDTLDSLPFFQPAKVRALLDGLPRLPRARRIPYEQLVQIVVGTVLLTELFGLRAE